MSRNVERYFPPCAMSHSAARTRARVRVCKRAHTHTPSPRNLSRDLFQKLAKIDWGRDQSDPKQKKFEKIVKFLARQWWEVRAQHSPSGSAGLT